MKTHVTIDGVTLTREQVEKALAELNKPTRPEPGTIVEFLNMRGIVMRDAEAKKLQYPSVSYDPQKDVRVIGLRFGDTAPGGSYTWSIDRIKEIKS